MLLISSWGASCMAKTLQEGHGGLQTVRKAQRRGGRIKRERESPSKDADKIQFREAGGWKCHKRRCKVPREGKIATTSSPNSGHAVQSSGALQVSGPL